MPEHIDLQNFLPFRLNRASTLLSRRLSELYRSKYGIDIPQWRVLATLGHVGTCTAQEVVSATYTHKSTISRAVNKLIQSGYIESFSSDKDKRESLLRFTTSGERLYQELVPLVKALEVEVFENLGEEKQQLEQALTALEHSIGITKNSLD